MRLLTTSAWAIAAPAEAGITTGVFYRNFTSKESLMYYCYSLILEERLHAVDVLLSGLPCEEQLTRYGLLLLQISADTMQGKMVFDTNTPDGKFAYEKCHGIAVEKLRHILEQAASHGEMDSASIPLMMDAFYVVIVGVGSYAKQRAVEKPTDEEWKERMIRQLIQGMLERA
ncbi:MAG: TetR/AcrR family transcriptional regulator [Clostridia bacterium]|nr:TetR/AcrR family transcriptional regulator [Clostridia bacterium]MBR0406787.1 TetR/AcrR family transcriptional regulator [Clostridia bacterium]